jgi:ankyrin repeat protein/predicted Ser/Thr protein kinase
MNPATIGGYEILRELGRGAMGVVYHARDKHIGRPVAIKVIRLDPGTSPEEGAMLRQRLIREASAAGKMYHPGIVTVHQLGEDGANVFIVMEYVEGASLEHLLANNRLLDRAWALDILAQTAVALDYAHKDGVVHRDVKPPNILVRGDGRVKIADFGIAKMTASATTGMTGAGVSVGSPAYMSPEQIQAKEIDGRSDQFALGTMAFQMLTGRLPFRGDTAHVVMYQIVVADPFEPQPGDAPLSPAERAILARALSKNPQDRFPDCASFIQQLTDASGVAAPVQQSSTAQIETPQVTQFKANRRWMILPSVGGLLALALAGGGIYWYLHWRCCAPKPVPAPIAALTPAPAPAAEGPPVTAPGGSTPSVTTTTGTTTSGSKSGVTTTTVTTTGGVTPNGTKPGAAKKPAPITAPPDTLISAVTYGRADVVKSMLAKGANINERDSDQNTPLMVASEGTSYLPNNVAMVELLIDARASLEAQDSRGRTALHRAAAAGRTNAVGFLLKSGALVNPKTKDGATPLAYAVEFGKMPVVQMLIAHSAKVDLADASGTTPLMIASEGTAYLPNSTPMVEALLTAGASVDLRDTRGRSALYRASAGPKPDAVRVLLEHKAKPNQRATDGSTPLSAAVTYSRPVVAQILLSHGADVNQADLAGTTPLMIAADASPNITDPAHFIKMLLEHGAKRELKDKKGRTALERATESKNTVAEGLLK